MRAFFREALPQLLGATPSMEFRVWPRPRSSRQIGSTGTCTWCWRISVGAAWRETDEDRTDYRTLIIDLLTGQYDHPLRVVAFNPIEGWSRDASEDVAKELEQRVAEGCAVTQTVREFIERFTGRPIGVQLLLPLREF